jgi:potassium efflux system protein
MNITTLLLNPRWLLILLLIIQSGSHYVLAEPTEPNPNAAKHVPTSEITKESLQAKIDALADRKGLDEAFKSKVLAIYQEAQDDLLSIAAFNERSVAFKNAIQKAPDLTKKLQKDIELASAKQPKPNADEFTNIPVEELTQRLAIEQDKVNKLNEQIKKLENELTEQNNRPNLVRQEILKARQELDNAHKETETPTSTTTATTDSKLENDAQQIYLKIKIDARTAELNMLDAENASYSARLTLLKTQLQLLGLQKNAFNPLISTIENVLTELKQQEEKNRQDALSNAEKELADKSGVIQVIIKENIGYSQKLQTINDKIKNYEQEKAEIDEQITNIEANFSSAAKKIDLASLSPPLGKLLHEQRRNLLNKDQFLLQSESIQEETANTDLEQLIFDEKLKKIGDIDAYLKQKMDLVDKKLPLSERMKIQAELRVLVNNQIELLNKLSIAYNTYLHTLGDFDFARQQRRSKAEKFALHLDEHLLWVRSSEAIGIQTVKELYKSIRWILSPHNWQVVINSTIDSFARNSFLTLLAILNISVLILTKNKAKQRLKLISLKVGKIYSDRFYYTLEVLLYSMIRVAPAPLTIAYLGWFLNNSASSSRFTQAIGSGLGQLALSWFLFQFCYCLFEPSGVMRKHFQWQEATANLMRKQLAWLRFVFIPCTFLIKVTLAMEVPIYSDSLGRLALNIKILAVVAALSQLLHPRHGLTQQIIMNYPNGWIAKSRYICYGIIFTPLIIIGFSVAGYYLSAVELQQKLMVTLWSILFMGIPYEAAIRWLGIVNQQLAIKNLQQKHKPSDKHPAVPGSEEPILLTDEEQIDIPKINAQTIKILNVLFCFGLIIGFWVIWKNIFPAFSFIERIELWQNKVIVNNKEVYQAITLINLLLAGVYGFITIVAVRNFSGVIELLIFRRITMEPGSRYAVNQLAKYVLMTIGFFSVANELGFSWSQVQWLVAALSVGLGFGLQEIFANFVSGIILLFERPIRVGDIVTIGDVTGTVNRIHMRATTLVDADQKELIVPNKTFITTQLINWSLSDAITRLVIPVGIAYGSDIELAHKVMLDTVRNTPLVLEHPEPSVLLLGFADSALQFSVRAFVSETAHRMPVTHNLHLRIAQALQDHDIEIPFPQRDIHIRSVTPEWTANNPV